jgi:uncharacterized protein YjbI with pentapeptide repeats
VDSSVVGYDGGQIVRDEEQPVGRKKLVRKPEPWKPPPEKRGRLEQQPKSRGRPTKNQVVRATKVPAALLITVLVISIIWLLWRDVIRVGGNSYYVLRGVLTVVGILILIGVGYRFEWTGFGERDREKSETGEIQRRKTLWDWMDLLLVPLMIAGIASWFTWWQNNSQQALGARQQAQLAESQAQYSALQSYIDQMSQLIDERDLRSSGEGEVVFTLAQARTTTTITQLDGEQNQIVTRFLSGSGLLRKPALLAKVGLEGAKLHRAVLQNANLAGTSLNGANLADAELISADFYAEEKVGEDTIFRTADLTRADLTKAALQEANLAECTLTKVTLTKAALQGADLSSASLRAANLSYAALQDADLSSTESPAALQGAPLRFLKQEATNLTDASLSHAALKDANLSSAVLQNANLTEANLTDANLTDAYLSDANLTDANLTDAKGWTTEQLTAARSLEGATMPDGETLKSDKMPHRPTFEEWLKVKKAREENE